MSREALLQRVTDPAPVKLLLHERSRKVLGCFLAQEQSVSGAAKQMGLDIRSVHRDVRALCAAGLLHITRREARAGRAIAYYRASAEAYFVPQSAHPSADQTEQLEHELGPFDKIIAGALGREFERALRESGGGESGQREWGTRLFLTPGGAETDQCFYDAELRGVLTGWQGPPPLAFTGGMFARLTDAQAREIQEEFINLIYRIKALGEANEISQQGRSFMLRMIQTPISEAEEEAFRRLR